MNRVAIIGLGNWGKKLLATFNKIAYISVCCTTGNKENLDWLNSHFPTIKYTKNFEEVIHDGKIDAIIIATPIDTHYEITRKTLLANKHVFVEKPLSTSTEQAKELLKIAKERKRILFTGNLFLYNDIFTHLEKLNKTSPFEHIAWNWNKFGTFKENIFWNLAWHDILMSVKLMGKAIDVKLTSYDGYTPDKDAVRILLDFENNKKSSISINRLSKSTEKSGLFITKDKSYAWSNGSLSFASKGSKELKVILQSATSALVVECKAFIDLLNNDSSKIDDDEIILETIRIIENLMRKTYGN